MKLNPIPSAIPAGTAPEPSSATPPASRAGGAISGPGAAVAASAAASVDPAELKNSVDAINRFLKVNSEVQFSIDDSSGQSVIKVIDTETKKILRQFPTQQALEIGKDFKGLKGLLIQGVA